MAQVMHARSALSLVGPASVAAQGSARLPADIQAIFTVSRAGSSGCSSIVRRVIPEGDSG